MGVWLPLVVLVGLVAASAATSSYDCTVGEVYVDNYIKFECFAEGAIVRGLRPIGKEHVI